jgi:N-acetylmuramoyl-L-alanine amidase
LGRCRAFCEGKDVISRPLAVAVLALCGVGAVGCGSAEGSDAADLAETGAASQIPDPAAPAAEAPAKPLAGKVVAIDPGHNGGNYRHPEIINKQVNILTKWKSCDTTGTATNDGYAEAAFTWDVSQRLAKLLKAKGATVKLTRKDNTSAGPCITERAAVGNRAKANAAISIHADGASAGSHGFHVIMPKKIKGPVDPVVAASAKLGVTVRNAFHAGTGLPYSNYVGTKALNFRNDLGGLNLSTVPKIFIECGNMRNAGDAAKLKDARFRQRIAESLAKGLTAYLT